MTDALRDKLNPVYARLFGPFFDRPSVEEKRATCDSCAMCDRGQVAPVDMGFFEPDLKCCTYYPSLPNYLVGAILSETSEEGAEGRARLRARIAARTGVTPMALMVPRKWLAIYVRARGAFGRAQSLRCPYYEAEGSGRCTIWRWREAVCSTFFCKYENGKPGWEFWGAQKKYLELVQLALCQISTTIIDKALATTYGDQAELTTQDVDDLPPTDAQHAAIWASWVGREEEFYKLAYAKVQSITPETFQEKMENLPGLRDARDKMIARYEALHAQTVLPQRLIRAADLKTRRAGESVVVSSYNNNDAFAIDHDLFEVLGRLDGAQSLEENLARLDREEDVQLEPELLQYLFTHGVVADPSTPPSGNT
ncbi:MAG: hypothetical protein JWP97_3827 [Labilithrix sp.]|nr:hypothetical protein [Labilithrix sp.]